ncbi:uncharacterized protein KD926_004561 [Aspergillus affinis]|uniref:uncharacterized protein n=1 Tax=Aspergillus affinis TaxID=1070780 RepID=UPI0022FE5150|nr:uncharacterized protein KD926_004561 [Aspergillus affinis]KAI9043058.1 hypothetical protein KD926_004561 [Aspergillus affinis]
MATNKMSSSADAPSADTPSDKTIDLWAYMACKNTHGPRVRRYLTARDEIHWGCLEIHEKEPTLKPDDNGILLQVRIWADIPKGDWKETITEAAYNHVDGVIKKELNKKDGLEKFKKDGLEKFLKELEEKKSASS